MRTDVLLLHGALGDHEQLAPLAARRGEAYRVHTVDFAGHGATPLGSRAFRVEAFAAQVTEFLDEAGLASVAIFGYSMGGYVALHLAATSPGRIACIARSRRSSRGAPTPHSRTASSTSSPAPRTRSRRLRSTG